jgi:hypothetical protein
LNQNLNSLRTLKKLKSLVIGFAPRINGSGLAKLGVLPELEGLGIKFSSITDEGLKGLQEHPKLLNLGLPDGVTSACLDRLPKLPALEVLYVPEKWTDADLEKAKGRYPKATVNR